MTATQAISNFIEFYLSPRVPSKFIELECLRITHNLNHKTNPKDEWMEWVVGFRKALRFLKKHQKDTPQFASIELVEEALNGGYLKVILMNPEDCLLMLSADRFKIPDPLLALILDKSEEHLNFKRKKMLMALDEHGDSFNPTQEIHASHFIPVHQRATLYQKFRALPSVVRFTIEASVVLLTLVSLMWVIPEIRNGYENAVQKRINDYLIESSLIDSPAPDGSSKNPKPVVVDATSGEPTEAGEREVQESTTPRKQPKVNEGETWRFSFTGASTGDLESGITDAIKQNGGDSPKPITVPGGIQFDFSLSTQNLLPLKNSLEEMIRLIRNKKDAPAHAANMSWYKKKNMGTRKLSAGQVQVVIWISTL